ncbi:hypothetical protein STTU_p0088 (plasmid) [Streptomyces sp. Tu6071]|nr:hypothetical protein STTU_p0088 [Streptomyces sp. Tu6071]
MCGVDSTSEMTARGESPRGRGQRGGAPRRTTYSRRIPAHAGPTSTAPTSPAGAAEDPRARGADFAPPSCLVSTPGGSPRSRGRLEHGHGVVLAERRIPACAGPTWPRPSRPCPSREDPRERRVDPPLATRPREDRGGSPRTRGRRSSARRARLTRGEDPRARGADLGGGERALGQGGGSPRSRGRREPELARLRTERRIPALAGPTGPPPEFLGEHPEDPRARGADRLEVHASPDSGGGSPRSRGRRGRTRCARTGRGRIPALAGPTRGGPASGCRPEDPRARGADLVGDRDVIPSPGGSPRSRGRLHGPVGRAKGERRIPALAGPTGRRGAAIASSTEDPRARGADDTQSGDVMALHGGSPRSRGRPGSRWCCSRQARRIPALAGPTSSGRTRTHWAREDPRARGADAVAAFLTVQATRRIPALAGPTHRVPCSGATTAEDPRARGADSWGDEVVHVKDGGSPRSRGRRALPPRGDLAERRIPALAGPTTRPW